MKLGCKLSSFNNFPTSFPKSDQLCLKREKYLFSTGLKEGVGENIPKTGRVIVSVRRFK